MDASQRKAGPATAKQARESRHRRLTAVLTARGRLGHRGQLRHTTVVLLATLAVAAAYYGAARLGLTLQLVRGQVTPMWPPTGIALAALLLLGLRVWPGITMAAFLVNLPIGPTLPATGLIAVGNTLAPVCAFLLLRRVRFRIELDRLRDGLMLVFLGALASMVVSATVGTAALVLSGGLPPAEFGTTWSVWWAGDAMGVLVVTPVLLVARTAPARKAHPGHWAEAIALLVGLAVVTVVATRTSVNLLFLVYPFLIWAALRFRLPGTAPCAVLVSLITIEAAVNQTGPFAGHSLLDNMITLQAFNGSIALSALLLSAVISERDHAHQALRHASTQLADTVAELARGYRTHHTDLLDAVLRATAKKPSPDTDPSQTD